MIEEMEQAQLLEQLENDFTYHPPKPGQPERYQQIRANVLATAQRIVELTPHSREQELALMRLEEAVFWANAAIARNE